MAQNGFGILQIWTLSQNGYRIHDTHMYICDVIYIYIYVCVRIYTYDMYIYAHTHIYMYYIYIYIYIFFFNFFVIPHLRWCVCAFATCMGWSSPQKNNQAVTALDPTLDNYDFVKYGIQLNWTIMILLITALVQHFGILDFFSKPSLWYWVAFCKCWFWQLFQKWNVWKITSLQRSSYPKIMKV